MTLATDTQFCRSGRESHSPSYLQDFVYATKYPIEPHMSYTNPTPSYKDYIVQVSAIYEPVYYHQACKQVEWCKAMEVEINALEANNTSTIQLIRKVLDANGSIKSSIKLIGVWTGIKQD